MNRAVADDYVYDQEMVMVRTAKHEIIYAPLYASAELISEVRLDKSATTFGSAPSHIRVTISAANRFALPEKTIRPRKTSAGKRKTRKPIKRR